MVVCKKTALSKHILQMLNKWESEKSMFKKHNIINSRTCYRKFYVNWNASEKCIYCDVPSGSWFSTYFL